MGDVTAWARTHGYKLFVGEFAGGNNPTCQTCISNFLTYLETNSDVYLGWTWYEKLKLFLIFFYTFSNKKT